MNLSLIIKFIAVVQSRTEINMYEIKKLIKIRHQKYNTKIELLLIQTLSNL